MADDPKSVAELLVELVDAAARRARSFGAQRQVVQGPMPTPTNPSVTAGQLYERCLGTLTPEERAEFARTLEKMLDTLGRGTP